MPRHRESQIQRAFVARFRLDPRTRDWPACAIPNGGRRGKVEAAILKAEGVSAGAPDWVCFVRSPFFHEDESAHGAPVCWHGLALEFKVDHRPSRITAQQMYWHNALREEQWRVAVVASEHEAWHVLCDTYGLDPNPR